MVQATTDGAMATDSSSDDSSSSSSEAVSWFTYEGPKISAAVSLGASKAMTFYGFQAITNITHSQSIAWGSATVAANGPLQTEIAIKGARKTVTMDLAATLTLAPGGYIHRYRAKSTAQGVTVQANGTENNSNGTDASAQVVGVQSTGTQNSTGPNLNANVNHNQG
ncbi:MAG: hypothetical protein RIB84_07600 [Sneathiellaceae bacterium]